MTPDADLGLGTRIDDGIGAELRGELKFAGRTHDLVAVNALDAPECMATGSPKCLVATLVANQAGRVVLFRRFARVRTEGCKRRLRGRSAHRLVGLFSLAHGLRHFRNIQTAGPVTRFAADVVGDYRGPALAPDRRFWRGNRRRSRGRRWGSGAITLRSHREK